jgi:DNA anti-recombination protein RmuC
MTEIEIGGVKFKGGKMLAVLMALSSAVGALYGGFEVYKDYMDMKEQISAYVAPDLSGIEQEIAVLTETVTSQNTTISAQKQTIKALETQISAQNESFTNSRTIMQESINRIDGDLNGVFGDLRDNGKRLYELEVGTNKELLDIRKSITSQIEEALSNPLSGQ